ncbi:MAG: hypothetical protein AB1589_32460 [Cyanobacteriota bacterium]
MVLFKTNRLKNPTYKLQTMYNKNSDKDWVGAAVTAAIGAGIVTSFAVSQGQHPLVALAITAFSTLVALLCAQLGLI